MCGRNASKNVRSPAHSYLLIFPVCWVSRYGQARLMSACISKFEVFSLYVFQIMKVEMKKMQKENGEYDNPHKGPQTPRVSGRGFRLYING